MAERNLTEQAITRLRRIEGQVRGIQRMLERMAAADAEAAALHERTRALLAAGKNAATVARELGISRRRVEDIESGCSPCEGDPCDNLLTQVLAVRAAVEQAGLLILELHLQRCAVGDRALSEAQLRDLRQALKLWSRLSSATR